MCARRNCENLSWTQPCLPIWWSATWHAGECNNSRNFAWRLVSLFPGPYRSCGHLASSWGGNPRNMSGWEFWFFTSFLSYITDDICHVSQKAKNFPGQIICAIQCFSLADVLCGHFGLEIGYSTIKNSWSSQSISRNAKAINVFSYSYFIP